jgi:hypothetical protein
MGGIPSKKGTDDYEVGYKKPPKHGQIKPGEVRNPNGPPKAKTQLYRYLCNYLKMPLKEIEKLLKEEKDTLTLVQHAALISAKKMAEGDWDRQKEVINRDEGKVPDRIAGPEGEPLKFYSGVEQEKV